MWLESKQHTSRSRVRDGVIMEIQRLSSRLGTVMSKWTPEYVLFSHSGILEIPLQVPGTLLVRLFVSCNYIPESLLLHVELIKVPDIRFRSFQPCCRDFVSAEHSGKKTTTFGGFNPTVQQQQTNSHSDNICGWWNSFFRRVW